MSTRDEGVGISGGGLHHAVELPGEGPFEAASNVAVRPTFQGAAGFVGATLRMTPQPGDRDGMQCPIQRTVSASVETVPAALPATGLERSDTGERGERGLVADPPGMRPAEQQPGSHDRADARLRKQRRPGRVLAQQTTQLRIEFVELTCEETDPGGDCLQSQYRDAVFDGGRGRCFDAGELLGERKSTQGGAEVFGCGDDQALEFVDGFGATDENPFAGRGQGADRFPKSAGSGTALMFARQSGACRADCVEVIVLRAAGSFEAADFGDVLTCLRQHVGQSGGEASGPFQRPDPSTGCVPARPGQDAGISGSVRRLRKVCVNATGDGVEYREVDSVAVGISADDEIVFFCKHGHYGCLPLRWRSWSAPVWEEVTCRGSTVRGHALRADKLEDQAKTSGPAGVGNPKGHVKCRAHANVVSILGSHLGSLIPA